MDHPSGVVGPMTADRSAMLDVWLNLGGVGPAFERMMTEDRRTDADTWAQLMAMIREDVAGLMADTNPPCGPEFEALILGTLRGIR